MRLKLAIIVIGSSLLLSPAVEATTLSFNFNSLANGAPDINVQNYMNGILGPGSVTVTGAQASNSYTGDGHVVGPLVGPVGHQVVTPLTLATSDGTTQHLNSQDTFIDNISSSTEISMVFHGLQIYSVSFDYEIFPDGTCPNGHNSCGANWPDFTFDANGNQIFQTLAVMPGTSPGAPYLHSPATGVSGTELAPQFLGQSGIWAFPAGVTKLEFIDWPATIGIDNLTINTTPPTPTPEPSTLFLFGTGLFGMALVSLLGMKRKKQKQTSQMRMC